MKEFKHLGVYGLVLNDEKILLVRKKGGPYDGKLDLPGGTIEFCEGLEDALKREFLEEVGIAIKSFKLFDADSVIFTWQYKSDLVFKVHHIGIFYKVLKYENEVKHKVMIDSNNDDSLGAFFYDISSLKRNELSNIAVLEIEKLGYNLK